MSWNCAVVVVCSLPSLPSAGPLVPEMEHALETHLGWWSAPATERPWAYPATTI
jgi:hypothetical protein